MSSRTRALAIINVPFPETGTAPKVDGAAVESHPMPKSFPIALIRGEPFNLGVDTGAPVDDADCQAPFRFAGTIDQLRVMLGTEQRLHRQARAAAICWAPTSAPGATPTF